MMLRKALFAGSFYDSNATRLKQDFEQWFSKAQIPEIKGKVTGVICPHAGYMYSGFCAAHSYKLLSELTLKTAVILHPSHRGNHFSFSVSPYQEYQTPLGNLELDNEMAEYINAQGAEPIDSWYHQNEHSMEVQLPFLVYIKPDIKIVPVMYGFQNPKVSKHLADILNNTLNDDTVAIVSTDLSHYHSAAEAETMDRKLINNIKTIDIEALNTNIQTGESEACDFAGIVTMLYIARQNGNYIFKELLYTNSGVISGDYKQVVGYLSAVAIKG
jgi:AmmeMemoRadiSam system protein B